MLFVAVTLLGLISWTRLPQELFPSLAYPQISIVTKYEGAGPEESEKLISKLLEETVGTVRNIRKVSSVSKEGMSLVICEFKWGTDMNFAALEVREKVDLIKERLPRDAQEPVVLKFNPFQMEAMVMSVSYDYNETDPWKMVELRQFCKKNLKDEFERIDGVAKVEIRGGEQKEILVEVDKGRLLANQLSLLDIIKTLRETNITYPAGTIKEEQYEYTVKTVGEFRTVPEVGDVLLTKDERQQQEAPKTSKYIRRESTRRSGSIIYLRDIAQVHESIKDTTGQSRYNQKDSISLSIFPQSGSNLVTISKLIHEKLIQIKSKIPKNVEVKVIYDQSDFIKSSLHNIYFDASLGGLLSFAIIYIFLQDIAAALIILVALPISILVALSLMYFSGISINTMSLGGLALGVGMVVDNANVVLEGIFAYLQKHPDKPKKEVIFEATNRQVVSVIASTLTLIAIFLPFIFVSGVAGQLFKEMALTITFSMVASIAAALILVPRLALNLNLDRYRNADANMKLFDPFKPLLEKFLLLPVMKTWKFLGAYLLIGVVLLYFIPKEFMPKLDEHRFTLNISFPPQTTLKVTGNLCRRIENHLFSIPEIDDVIVNAGSSGEDLGTAIESLGSNQARIIVRLKKKGRSTDKVISELSDEIKHWKIDNLDTEFISQQGLFGSSLGSSSGLTIEVKGKNLADLEKKSDEIKAELAQMPDIYGVKTIPSDLVPELKLEIQRERASLFGLNVQDISATLVAAIRGYVATRFKEMDDEYDVRVRLRPEDRSDLSRMGELTIFSPFGRNIQLAQISDLHFVKSLPEIRRIEGQRTYLITANVKKNFSGIVKHLQVILDESANAGDAIATSITGETLALRESMSSAVFALIMAVVIIYMILASQFESLMLPLIVMITIPMGLVGGIYALFMSFNSINSVSMQGMIMLIGLVVNSGIILVDRYNVARVEEPGKDLKTLVIECTVERLRPILMTTLTTILGVLPTALAVGDNATSPMAITIVGGETFRLILTLFFIPSAYLLIENMKKKKM